MKLFTLLETTSHEVDMEPQDFGGGGFTGVTKPPTIYDVLNIQPLHFWIIVILGIIITLTIIYGIKKFKK